MSSCLFYPITLQPPLRAPITLQPPLRAKDIATLATLLRGGAKNLWFSTGPSPTNLRDINK